MITLFPNNPLYPKLLKSLQEQRSAKKAILSEDDIYSRAYLKLYPTGKYWPEIKKHLASLSGGELDQYNENLFNAEMALNKIASKINGIDITDLENVNVSEGDIITYLYTVTNTGNVPITDVNLADNITNGSGTLTAPGNEILVLDKNTLDDSIDIFDDGTWDILGVGDVISFTSLYTVAREDIELSD